MAHTCDSATVITEGTELGGERVWSCSVCGREMIRRDLRPGES
ncbi:hypothetical protein [Actinosynnema sp. NPDC023587]